VELKYRTNRIIKGEEKRAKGERLGNKFWRGAGEETGGGTFKLQENGETKISPKKFPEGRGKRHLKQGN